MLYLIITRLLFICNVVLIISTKKAGKADFEMLEKKTIEWGEPRVPSAKQVGFSIFRLFYVHRLVLFHFLPILDQFLSLKMFQELAEMIFQAAL